MDVDDIDLEPSGKEFTLKSGKTILYKVKKSSKFTMTVVEWILLSKKLHSIRVEHSKFSGRKRIFLDNTCIKEQTDFLDTGLTETFPLEDSTVTVDVYTNGIDFYYALLIDGEELN
jgi:hypothetical protein